MLKGAYASGGRGVQVLLYGEPGNGKTMACRWVWEQCRQRRWEWRLVTPDTYRQALRDGDPVEAVRGLFGTEPKEFRPGIDPREVRERYGLSGGPWLLTPEDLSGKNPPRDLPTNPRTP